MSQQGPHALLTINLWQDMANSGIDNMIDIELGYHVTILAGPAT